MVNALPGDIHVSETGTLFFTQRSRTNRGPTLALLLEALAHPCTKVPVVLEALAHPSTKVADGGRGSRTSEHQGADGARGSRTSEPPRFRWCSRLPHILAPRCPRLPHDQGPMLPEGSPEHRPHGSPEHRRDGSPEHRRDPNRRWGGPDVRACGGRGPCPGQPLLAQYHLPPKELKKLGQCATRRHSCV